MRTQQPVLILSGASGFIGRYLLEAFKEDYYIYAIARRAQHTAGVEQHRNIVWIRLDIADEQKVKQIIEVIARNGGADYFIHLAAFYDFRNQDNPEYQRTNVHGTENFLKYCDQLNLKRFIFASSLTVTEFTTPGIVISEKSAANARFPYALSKAVSEESIRSYADKFPCTVVRQAAIYSDWCEYLPLYSFLSTWLAGNWRSRLLAGKGMSAVPYLHINDLVKFFSAVLQLDENTPKFDILIASPDQSLSHLEIFNIVAQYHYFHQIKPVRIPKPIVTLGIIISNLCGIFQKKRPFEKLWMIKYIDWQMKVNTNYTCQSLKWQPTPRLSLERRLLFLIDKMNRNPFEWKFRNEMKPAYAYAERKNLIIYETMLRLSRNMIEEIFEKLVARENALKFRTYQSFDLNTLFMRVEYMFHMLENDIRTGDRSNILDFGQHLAEERFLEGFDLKEVISAVELTGNVIVKHLLEQPELQEMEQSIQNEIIFSIQMLIDKIEDTYDYLKSARIEHNKIR